MIRKRIYFYGHVQGVGFRYRSEHAAYALGLTGWVRNEYDGSVTMEIQGDESSIDRFIQILYQDMYIDIERMESKYIEPDEDERSFSVRD